MKTKILLFVTVALLQSFTLLSQTKEFILSGGSSKTWKIDYVIVNQDTVSNNYSEDIMNVTTTFSQNSISYSDPLEPNKRIIPQDYQIEGNNITTSESTYTIETLTNTNLVVKTFTVMEESGDGVDGVIEHQNVPIYFHYSSVE